MHAADITWSAAIQQCDLAERLLRHSLQCRRFDRLPGAREYHRARVRQRIAELRQWRAVRDSL